MMRRYVFLAILWFAASPLGAATVRWTGAAQDVRGVWTIAVTGTWATGDTATLTINNKSLTVTVGSSTTTSNVADILARAVDARNTTEDLLGNESRNFGGEEIPEFAELDASSSGATLTITTEQPGVSLTASSGSVALTRSESTAGDGALGSVTEATAATGKNWLSNAANYSGGAVPSDNDTLIFDSGDVDVLYGLTHFRANNIDLTILVTNDYTGQIGNATENPLGYTEYRARYFQYRGGSKTFTLSPGFFNTTAAGKLFIDMQDQASVTVNLLAARQAQLETPSVMLCGSDSTTGHGEVRIVAGYVAIEPTDAPTASGKGFMPLGWIIGEVGAAEQQQPIVEIGSAARMSGGDGVPLQQNSGEVFCDPELFTDATHETQLTIDGGTFELRNTGDISVVTIGPRGKVVFSGEPVMNGNVKVMGGVLDLSRCPLLGATTGDVLLYAGATYIEPVYASPGEINFVGCRPQDCTLTLPPNRAFVYTSAAP